ncbi:MAG TPA: hypothetical protein VGF22_10500 [Acidimicrobiales bacterium]
MSSPLPPPDPSTVRLASPAVTPVAAVAAPASAVGRSPAGFWMVVSGAGLAVLAAFLPWVSVSAGFVSQSWNGLDRDGKFTLMLGIAVGIVALVSFQTGLKRGAAWAVGVAATGGLVLMVVDAADGASRLAKVNDLLDSYGHASLGVGVYLTFVAMVLVIVGAVLSQRRES